MVEKTYEQGLMDMLEWVLSAGVISSPTTQRHMRQYLLFGGKFNADKLLNIDDMKKYISERQEGLPNF